MNIDGLKQPTRFVRSCDQGTWANSVDKHRFAVRKLSITRVLELPWQRLIWEMNLYALSSLTHISIYIDLCVCVYVRCRYIVLISRNRTSSFGTWNMTYNIASVPFLSFFCFGKRIYILLLYFVCFLLCFWKWILWFMEVIWQEIETIFFSYYKSTTSIGDDRCRP